MRSEHREVEGCALTPVMAVSLHDVMTDYAAATTLDDCCGWCSAGNRPLSMMK